MAIMLSRPSFRQAFLFTINSLILSGFPLTSFPLVEASLSAFSWFYTLACAVVHKYHEILWFIIIHILSTHFAINLFFLHNLKSKLTSRSIVWLSHKQCDGIIKGWFHCQSRKDEILSMNVFNWQLLITYIFSVYLKSRACYITGQ